MATFTKPSTPTKSRSINRPLTPTRSKSISNTSGHSSNQSINVISSTSSTKVLEEINLLLYLETIKRSRDSEISIKQKVEEAYRLFEERRNKYFSLVAKYASLVKLASTRKVLLCNGLIDFPTESAQKDAKSIKDKLSSGSATDYINTKELNKFREILNDMEKYTNLPIKRSELADLQSAVDDIQYSIEAIEISLDKCTTQGLDYFTESLDMANYPKLHKENKHNEY